MSAPARHLRLKAALAALYHRHVEDLFSLAYREIGSHEAMSGVRWIDLDMPFPPRQSRSGRL